MASTTKKNATQSLNTTAAEPKPKKVRAKRPRIIGDLVIPAEIDRNPEQSRQGLRFKVRFFYDLQRMRMQVSGRINHNTPEEQEKIEQDEEIKQILKPANDKRPVIELHTVDQQILSYRALELEKAEKNALKDIEDHLNSIPFYVHVLSDKTKYRGVGPTMAGVILSEFDIHLAESVSKMWKYAGIAPIPAHRCKLCQRVVEDVSPGKTGATFQHDNYDGCARKGHVVGPHAVFASGRAMRPTKGEKLPYNSFLKTKLLGVLGGVLLKLNSPWRKFYDDYKHRWQSQGRGVSDGHRHKAAIRYMIKMLLLQLYQDWRKFEGLSVRQPYQEQYLGHRHHGPSLAESFPAE